MKPLAGCEDFFNHSPILRNHNKVSFQSRNNKDAPSRGFAGAFAWSLRLSTCFSPGSIRTHGIIGT